MTTIDPVIDPTSDYDIFDPQYLLDPFPTIEQIRQSSCPVAHTERWGGSWMPTRYADIVAVAQEHDVFTSRQILVTGPPDGQEPEGAYAGVAAPPISSDPPEHHWHRRLILPFFAPQAVAKYEHITRDLCNELIDRFIDNGEADSAADYAQQIPVRVIATMLGVPTDMSDTFTGWVRGVLEAGLVDQEVRLAARGNILGFFFEQVADRQANPREDDLLSLIHISEPTRPY